MISSSQAQATTEAIEAAMLTIWAIVLCPFALALLNIETIAFPAVHEPPNEVISISMSSFSVSPSINSFNILGDTHGQSHSSPLSTISPFK